MDKQPDKKAPMKKTAKGNSRKSSTGSILGKVILVIGLILFVMVIGVGCGFLTASLNTKQNLAEDIVPPASSQIYDINGNEIANIHAAENRMPVSINDIPKNLQNAFVAVEDNRFYDHAGIDPRGIVQPQGALVAIDPHTGYIKAMVGGRGTDQFNRATQAVRQPGSAFKTFVFAAALENKYTPDSVIEDKPLKVGGWEPQNYNRKFSGKVRLRDVVRWSLNVPTVRIAQDIGIDKAIYYAQEMGISTFVLDGATNDRNLATALGGMTRGVTPLELTSAFGTFANRGIHVEPVAVLRVVSRTGKVLEEATRQEKSVISAVNAATMTNMLSDVIRSGTGTGANIGRPAAGKTGTTSDYHDAWFVGYTPDLVAGVWIGNDSVSDLHGMAGGTTPAAIWRAFMLKAHERLPVRSFEGSASYKPASELDDLNDDSEKDKDKDDKDTSDNKDKNHEKTRKKTNKDRSASEPRSPSSAPSVPDEVPTRGAGVEKGRN